jgi:hypothetical protein
MTFDSLILCTSILIKEKRKAEKSKGWKMVGRGCIDVYLYYFKRISEYWPDNNLRMASQFAMKEITPAQAIAGKVGVLLACAAFVCAVVWSTNTNETDKYLGGLDWNRYVFNWHVVCMIGFISSFSVAIICFRLLPLGKPINKALHGFFHTLALFCLIVGLIAGDMAYLYLLLYAI